jgi:hypothetical protein
MPCLLFVLLRHGTASARGELFFMAKPKYHYKQGPQTPYGAICCNLCGRCRFPKKVKPNPEKLSNGKST